MSVSLVTVTEEWIKFPDGSGQVTLKVPGMDDRVTTYGKDRFPLIFWPHNADLVTIQKQVPKVTT